MNSNRTPNFHQQSGFNNQTIVTTQNQYHPRLSNVRFNYPSSFNHNSQSPAFPNVPTANTNLQPSTLFRPPHPFNTPHPTPNQSRNVPASQHSYSHPQTPVYGDVNINKPPTLTQSLNNSSTAISHSSTYATTTSCFSPNPSNYRPQVQRTTHTTSINYHSQVHPTTHNTSVNCRPQAQPVTHNTSVNCRPQAQPVTHNTSFQSKETNFNNFQGQVNSIPPPHNIQIPRPLNMPPSMPPQLVNYQRPLMSSSYNPNFAMPPPPPGIPIIQNLPSQLIDKSSTQVNTSLPPVLPNSFPVMPQNIPVSMPVVFSQTNTYIPPAVVKPVSEEESKLLSFLEKFTCNEKKKPVNYVSVAQFRAALKQGLSLVRKLMICKENLSQLLQSDEKEWGLEVNKVMQYQNQLAQACNFLTMPKYLNCIRKKLELIKKKRNSMKKLKQNILNDKMKKLKEREQLNQEIDKWLDSIKEKNLKLKRETEMKKEADSILSEVRRKIQEAKRTIEKIKVFEKLRNTRQSNAAKKGLFLPEHDERFKSSISNLKETVYRQLSHYESEEKALKVMLEAEQEGQLEEEAKWKVKRMRTLQQKRQSNIIESLFGNSNEPEEDQPIYLFYQFQNSGNKSIENLVQIRHRWDVHISESGEPVPHQWIVPVPPSSSGWEVTLNS